MGHGPVKVGSAFYNSLVTLDASDGTVASLRAMTLIAAAKPQYGDLVPKMDVRSLKTYGHGPFQPCRIFYWVNEAGTVYLLEIDTYF